MKHLILILALLTPSIAFAIATPAAKTPVPPETLKLVADLNKASQNLALCHAYHVHTDNPAGITDFEQHSDDLIAATIDFFGSFGSVPSSHAQFSEVYYNNVEIMLDAFRNGTVATVAELPEIGNACNELSTHFEQITRLLKD